jgi:large subunit ribosomal protein L30e
MVDQQLLGRVLKEAMKSGKYTLGTKEVVSEVKSSKLVIAAAALPGKDGLRLREEAEKNKVPLLVLDRNSAQLGRLLGRPYKVSAVAIRSISESDLRQLQA